MAIKNIGGRTVYVVEPVVTGPARTSTGNSYANLVSSLRWQIWEEAQKSVLQSLEFEKMGYAAELDAYKKQKEALTKALAKTKELKERAKSGELTMTQALSLAGKEQNVEDKKLDRELRYGATRVSSRPLINPITGLPIRGAPKPGEKEGEILTVESGSYYNLSPEQEEALLRGTGSVTGRLRGAAKALGIETAEDRKTAAVSAAEAKLKASEDRWKEMWAASGVPADQFATSSEEAAKINEEVRAARAELETLKGAPASTFKAEAEDEAELDSYYNELQAELDTLVAPEVGFDTNVLSRTREAFGGMAGVGGFGFSRRPSKTSPIYDEPRAKERIAEATETFRSLQAADAANAADRARLTDRIFLLEDQKKELFNLRPENLQENVAEINMELEDLYAQRDAISKLPTAGDFAERFRTASLEAGPGERTAKTFMERGIPPVAPPLQKGEVLPTLPTARFEEPVRERFPKEVPGETFKKGTYSETPVAEVTPLPERDGIPSAAFQPAAPSAPRVGDTPMELSKEDIKPDPTILDNPNFVPTRDLVEEALKYFKELTIQEGGEKPRKVKDAVRYFNGEKEMVKAYILELRRKETPVGENLPPQTSTKPKSRQEKYTSSLYNVIKKGSALAEKPAKLARLAKTDLPEKERAKVVPEHILLVDKIYDINKGKKTAYKDSYAEIERVYSKDEKKRAAAQEYLTAKHLLQTA